MNKNTLRLLLAGALLIATLPARAAIAPAENLLPADTIAFITVPDCNALRAASKVSPQLMCWNDPAMKPFRDKFMGKLTEKFIGPLEKEFGIDVDDYTSLPQGQFTIAVTVNGAKPGDEAPPGMILLMDAKDKSEQLKTNLTSLMKKMTDKGRVIRTEKIRGLVFNVVTLGTNETANLFGKRKKAATISQPDGPEEKPVDIYFAQQQSLLIVANSAKALDTVASQLTGGSVPSIADNAVFTADKLSQFRAAPTYYGWFNAKLFFNFIAQAKDDDEGAPGLFPKLSPAKVLAATGLDNLKSASFALQESREGSIATFHLNSPAENRAGLLKILSLPAKDSAPPAFVPADAIKYSRVRLDGKATWAELQKMFANISPQALATINSVIDMANMTASKKDPGFDLRNQLFGNLGDDLVSYGKPPLGDSIGALSSPPSILLLASPKAEEMIQAIKTVGGLITPQDATTAPREFRGHKIHSLALRPKNSPAGAVPQPPVLLCAANGYLAITTDNGILEEFLRSAEGKIKPLRELPGLAEAAGRVGGMGNGLFTYQNQRETMRMTFKIFKAAAENDATLKMFPPEFREWADFTLLPEYERVSKYFHLSVVVGDSAPDGLTLKIHSPRPPGLN